MKIKWQVVRQQPIPELSLGVRYDRMRLRRSRGVDSRQSPRSRQPRACRYRAMDRRSDRARPSSWTQPSVVVYPCRGLDQSVVALLGRCAAAPNSSRRQRRVGNTTQISPGIGAQSKGEVFRNSRQTEDVKILATICRILSQSWRRLACRTV